MLHNKIDLYIVIIFLMILCMVGINESTYIKIDTVSPLVITNDTVSIPMATANVNGYLDSTNWSRFNSAIVNDSAYTSLSVFYNSLALKSDTGHLHSQYLTSDVDTAYLSVSIFNTAIVVKIDTSYIPRIDTANYWGTTYSANKSAYDSAYLKIPYYDTAYPTYTIFYNSLALKSDTGHLHSQYLTSDVDTAYSTVGHLHNYSDLTTTYKTADSAVVITGGWDTLSTPTFNTMFDTAYHIDEVTGEPGYDVRVYFSGLTHIENLYIRYYYVGSATHANRIQGYKWSDSTWLTLDSQLGNQLDYKILSIKMPSCCETTFISGGNAIFRFYHTESGNASHDLYIDYFALVY